MFRVNNTSSNWYCYQPACDYSNGSFGVSLNKQSN